MKINKLTGVMLLAGMTLSFTASAASLTMNDDTNTISGLNTNEMISKDNGSHWVAYTNESQNSFMGAVTVIVANKDDNAINAIDYDASTVYNVTGTQVRYNGYYWTNKWWTQGEVPGSSDVWQKGSAININKLATFTFTPYTGQKATDFQNSEKAKVAAQRKIIGYFPEWGIYGAHNNFTADKVDYTRLTHLNYGFALVKNGVLAINDSDAANAQIPLLDKLTEENNVKYMISVGGWNNSQEGVFEAATATAAGVEKLANSMLSFMQQWGFDGIDIDWEYPDTAAEQAQFTSLIQSLRSKLDTLGKEQDKYFQLSAAVTTNHNNIGFINPKVTAPLLDSVNVMAYDIHGAFDAITGHNAPLFANGQDSDKLLNVASTLKEYHETWGVPKAKLMMGVPYYGRGWGSVEPTEKVTGLPGLFANGSATVHGAWDDTGQFTGTNPYYVLKEYLASGDYKRYWDDESKVPYLYNARTKEFLTYDDQQSIQTKVDYINSEGYGGAIIWDLSGDTSDYELGKIVGTLMNTSVPDDGDESGDGDQISDGSVSDAQIVRVGYDFDWFTYAQYTVSGVRFTLSDSNFRNHSWDIRVNNKSVATIVNGSVTSGSFKTSNDNIIVTTTRLDMKPNDVITIVQTDGASEQVKSTLTATRQSLQIGIIEENDVLADLNYYYSSTYGYRIVQMMVKYKTEFEIQLYVNDKYVASLKQVFKVGPVKTVDHMFNREGTPGTSIWVQTADVAVNAGDDIKVYEIVSGERVLRGQLVIPASLEFGI